MTNEEAIKLLDDITSYCDFTDEYGDMIDSTPYYEALAFAIKALEQEPKTEWIPVSERLPIKEGSYMCTLIGEHDTGEPRECSFMPYGTKGMIGGWSTCEADGFVKLTDSEVIAWMPLPEPYKAESDKEKDVNGTDLCKSCNTKWCIFQSGIARSHCDFYKAESEK